MQKQYIVTKEMGFSENKTIPVFIFKKQIEVEEDGEKQFIEQLDYVEAFESAFSSKAEITKFKKILAEDLEIAKVDFRLVPRGDMTPEDQRPEEE